MPKINILYWVILPLGIISIFVINNQLKFSLTDFVGFAENKQNEINIDQDITITKIFIKTGDHVKKGQVLLEASRPALVEEVRQTNLIMTENIIKNQLEQKEIKLKITELENQMVEKISDLNLKIKTSKSESLFYKELANKSSLDQNKGIQNPKAEYISGLENEIVLVQGLYQKQINSLLEILNSPSVYQVENNKNNSKKDFLLNEDAKLKIVAPYDGIVGNINVREGENVKSFSSLISFYESSPPLVTAFIHEKYIGSLSIGDSVIISSAYNAAKNTSGTIIGKGHRVVEIPEKFRKIADIKTYGVEIFIGIDPANQFLQKEVLKIKLIQK